MADEEQTFYVKVGSPSELRKEFLGCSKEIISILRNHDSVNEVRRQKIEKIIELKKILSEIKRLNLMLKEKLPSHKIRINPVKLKKEVAEKKTVKRTAPKKPNNEIKQLESELTEIEDKLSKMGV